MSRYQISDEGHTESRIDRRSYLKLAGGVVASAALLSTPAAAMDFDDDHSNEIGGGDSYRNTVSASNADYEADSVASLHDALSRADGGDIVFVTGDIAAGTETFELSDGVTLAGDRGTGGSAGPTLSTDAEHYGMVEAGANSRVTGLRFDGPIYEYDEGTDAYPAGSAIETTSSGVEVDNCEIFGFSWAGVDVRHDAHVHHSHIHHCSRDGLGYGVLVANGSHPLIEYNYFNYNRHSIAGNDHDDEGTGYEVRFNVFGPDVIQHVVDMHEPGGKSFEVHHNTFVGTEVLDGSREMFGVVVRGVPSDVYEIHHNWFYHTEGPPEEALYDNGQAIAQWSHDSEGFVNVEFWDNHYGPDEPADTIGAPREGNDGDGSDGGGGDGSEDDTHRIVVSSPEEVSYKFTVTGDIEAITDGSDAEAEPSGNDEVSGSTASGYTGNGYGDAYDFTGTIKSFDYQGEAVVTIDGQRVDPTQLLSHTLTIAGDGSYSSYVFTVSGSLEGEGLTGEDSISGSTATGAVGAGRDSYRFSGDVTDFDLNGDATVSLDGVRVDPTQFRSRTLTIDGDGSYTAYRFSVSGDLEGEGLTGEDSISGATATGAVGPGRDSYTFTGDVIDFSMSGDATVYLDGEEIDPAQLYSRTLTIDGDGSYTAYRFSVSGDLEGEGLTGEDSISGSSATGAVGAGRDSYTFSGEITDFSMSGDAAVYLDGEEVDPIHLLPHTLVIDGDGSYTGYRFSVSGTLKGTSLTGEDSISGSTATGAVGAGRDSYAFSGDISGFDINGDATVSLDGEEIDPGTLG